MFKIYTEAKIEGVITQKSDLGIQLVVKAESLCNEVKKNGLIYDNCDRLELRKGDNLVIYLSIKF